MTIQNRHIIIILCLFFLCYQSNGQSRSFSCYDTIEISKTNIAWIKEFNGLAAKAFGIGIGMKIKEARDSASNFRLCKLLFEQDKFNNNRFYLYAIPEEGKRVSLAYCKWTHKDSGMKEMIIYETAKPFMDSTYSRIFSCDVLDSASGIYTDFFGKPADSKIELEIASIRLKTTRYYYPQLALIFIVSETADKTSYQLVLYDSRQCY